MPRLVDVPVHGWTPGCLHLLAAVSAAVDLGVQMSVQVPEFSSFVFMTPNAVVASYGNFSFSF